MTRRLLGLVLLTLTAPGAAAAAVPTAVAPGRALYTLTAGRHDGVDPQGVSAGVSLPDGRLVVASGRPGSKVELLRLRRDGSVDTSFGTAGVAYLGVPDTGTTVGQVRSLLAAPDGGLLVVSAAPPPSKYEGPLAVVTKLTPSGAVDPSFGSGGTLATGLQNAVVALDASGRLLVTGVTGQVSPTIEHDPNAPRQFNWLVARYDAAGRLDPTFAAPQLASGPVDATQIAATPAGGVLVSATIGTQTRLVRLLGDGRPDPAFAGITVPGVTYAIDLAARPDGGADMLTSLDQGVALLRVTGAGALDASFGNGGSVPIVAPTRGGDVYEAPGGGALAATPTGFGDAGAPVGLAVTRVDATGHASTATAPLPFGGGLGSFLVSKVAPRVMPLAQTGFRGGRTIARPDGSLAVLGAVGAIVYSGEGEGDETDRAAVASLTPGLQPDPAFGGPASAPTIAASFVPQTVRTATTRIPRAIRIGVNTSAAGRVLLTVRRGRTIVAQSTAVAWREGGQTLLAQLTVPARKSLRRARGVRLRATVQFQDLFGATKTVHASGRLR